jgi:hypothetical protein
MFEHQLKIKIFHFQTEFYGAHKSSDAYLEKFMMNLDKFMEVSQGALGKLKIHKLQMNIQTVTDLTIAKELDNFIENMRDLNIKFSGYPEILTIRDDIVQDAEQLKYLLTFK